MPTTQPSDTNRIPAVLARRRPAIVLAITITSLALLAAGCGASSPTRSTPQSPKSMITAAFKYSGCMRNHGVTSFPEPRVFSNGGQQSIELTVPSSDAGSPQFTAAQKACDRIMPAPGSGSPTQLAEQQHAREVNVLAFTRCLRSHGIPDFPDPTSQGRLTPQMVDAAGVDLHAPGLLTAAKVCIGVTHGAITAADVESAVNGS
jgi:hypothetical protein